MTEENVLTSSFCEGGHCVGVEKVAEGVAMFNTQNPELRFLASAQEWRDFIRGVKNGDFDDFTASTSSPGVGDHVAGTQGGRPTLDVGADSGLV